MRSMSHLRVLWPGYLAETLITVDTTEDKKASQKVWIDGKLVSSQTDTMDGYPAYLYSSNECYKNQCGSINAYCKSPPSSDTQVLV